MQYQSDYVLRLIEQMGSLIRRAMERLGVGESEQTYDLTTEAIGLALDIDPGVAGRLSPATLVSLLELNNADDRVISLVAEALDLEATALESAGEVLEAGIRRDQAAAVRGMRDPRHAN